MFTESESILIKKWFPFLTALILFAVIVFPGGLSLQQNFYLAHDYPFDYKNLKHLYVSESTGRISSLAIVSLAPNILLSKFSSIFGVYIQTFIIKIAPYFVFTYFYLKFILKIGFVNLNNWQMCFYLFCIYFMVTLGISIQMAINTGLFFNILFQLNFYIFIFHITLYLKDQTIVNQNKFNLLTFLLLNTSILLGSTFIPIIIYILMIYANDIKAIFNKKYLLHIWLILTSIAIIYLLLKIHGISLITNIDENNNFQHNKAYQAIRGGFFYQFIGFSNWGIYTGWEDRLFGGFTHFYKNPIFQMSLFSLNAVSLFFLYKKRRFNLLIILAVFLLLSVGNQPPFGFIYIWLLENLPGFASIRTPDNKFGLFIQAILLLNLLMISSEIKLRQILHITVFITIAIIFLMPSLITGKTVFGFNSIFSERSTYILNNSFDRQIASKLSKDNFVLLIPGSGNYDHQSGRVGPIDPMPYYVDHYISYQAVIGDSHSPYFSYLAGKKPEIPPEINAVVYRKSFPKFANFEWASQGFSIAYEDEHTVLYKRQSDIKIPSYSNYYLYYIISACIFLYSIFFYFLVQYVRNPRKI